MFLTLRRGQINVQIIPNLIPISCRFIHTRPNLVHFQLNIHSIIPLKLVICLCSTYVHCAAFTIPVLNTNYMSYLQHIFAMIKHENGKQDSVQNN